MDFFDFEKSILAAVDTWNPTAVNRDRFRIIQYGFGDQPSSGLRLCVGFIYDTAGEGDRQSLGGSYLERTPCRVAFDFFHGGSIPRKDFLNLFTEFRDWSRKKFAARAFQWDVDSGYLEESREAVLSLIMTARLERTVTI